MFRCKELLNSLGSNENGHVLHIFIEIQILLGLFGNFHQQDRFCKFSVEQLSTGKDSEISHSKL